MKAYVWSALMTIFTWNCVHHVRATFLPTMPKQEFIDIIDCIDELGDADICMSFFIGCHENWSAPRVTEAYEGCSEKYNAATSPDNCKEGQAYYSSLDIPSMIYDCTVDTLGELTPEEDTQMRKFESCTRNMGVECDEKRSGDTKFLPTMIKQEFIDIIDCIEQSGNLDICQRYFGGCQENWSAPRVTTAYEGCAEKYNASTSPDNCKEGQAYYSSLEIPDLIYDCTVDALGNLTSVEVKQLKIFEGCMRKMGVECLQLDYN